MAASLYPGPVALTPLLSPRSAAGAYCSGALYHATAWTRVRRGWAGKGLGGPDALGWGIGVQAEYLLVFLLPWGWVQQSSRQPSAHWSSLMPEKCKFWNGHPSVSGEPVTVLAYCT